MERESPAWLAMRELNGDVSWKRETEQDIRLPVDFAWLRFGKPRGERPQSDAQASQRQRLSIREQHEEIGYPPAGQLHHDDTDTGPTLARAILGARGAQSLSSTQASVAAKSTAPVQTARKAFGTLRRFLGAKSEPMATPAP